MSKNHDPLQNVAHCEELGVSAKVPSAPMSDARERWEDMMPHKAANEDLVL